jgi:tetratricopeptide (TPR) repeat protein
LKVLSFFDPNSISVDMITQGADLMSYSRSAQDTTPSSPVLAASTRASHLHRKADGKSPEIVVYPRLDALLAVILSSIELHNTIMQLVSRSLIKYQCNNGTSMLCIHNLTKIVVQSTMNDGAEREWFEFAVQLACRAFGRVEEPRAQCEMFIPHLQSLTLWDETYDGGSMSLMTANMGIARYLRSCGRHNEAETIYRKVLKSREKHLGPEHPGTLEAMHGLANITYCQKGYDEAEKLNEKVREIRTKQLGPEHSDTLSSMHGLALVYEGQQRFDMAETLCRQVLDVREQKLGSEHHQTLSSMHALARIYRCQKRHNDAESLYLQVLEHRRKTLGAEHPDTLKTMHSLAGVYRSQRRYNDAKALYGPALTVRQNSLGAEHPETLRTERGLAKAQRH